MTNASTTTLRFRRPLLARAAGGQGRGLRPSPDAQARRLHS